MNPLAAADRSVQRMIRIRARQLRFIVAAIHAEEKRQQSPAEPPSTGVTPASLRTPVVAATTSIDCGGEYPPCYVAQRESGNTYNAFNPTGCGGNACYGRWQFSGAWAGKLGLPQDLSQATPDQQDAAARELWAGGAGCSNWAAC